MPSISDFHVGDKVLFGRGNGEQTQGTVVKVNRKKLKVRQDESRGTMRSYRIGTLWTVPPSLCRKVESSTPAPTTRPVAKTTRQTPREILAAKGIHKGDTVEFTFKGLPLTGTIARINQKRVTIENISNPRFAAGVYVNPASIIRKVDASTPAKRAFKKGQTIEFQGYSWNSRGLTTIKGIVTKVNQGTCEIFGGGVIRVFKAEELTPANRRSFDDIISECDCVYGHLSPENLTCDGEASRTHIRRRSAELRRALKALWIEAGREITEDECWNARRKSA